MYAVFTMIIVITVVLGVIFAFAVKMGDGIDNEAKLRARARQHHRRADYLESLNRIDEANHLRHRAADLEALADDSFAP